ncbi:unnamed protein product [Cladocopium goreaui]|uniref:Uncharacterized protein n=1 Tax=Cladocopium goreaui TaxID=2562237 RepID=A0A9P1C3M6_9DINO|nr:unnamed protein product [Cladocopium goreaui]
MRRRIKEYNRDHAVRKKDLMDENVQGWGTKRSEKIRGRGKYREWTSAAILRVACSPQLQLLSSAVLGYR